MANFTLQELFGVFASIEGESNASATLTIYTEAFLHVSSDMPAGLGAAGGSLMTPTQFLYAFLLRLMKVQATTINGDPEQKIFIANSGKSLARGVRDGQIKQTFTISFFHNKGVAGIPPIDDIDE